MENNQAATARPMGLCERLFSALHLNHAFRSLRRIGYCPQEPRAAAVALPPPPPTVPSSTATIPAPPTKSSGLGFGGAPVQATVPSEKEEPERRPSRNGAANISSPMRIPSSKGDLRAVPVPSKSFAPVEPRGPPPLPSRLLTDPGASSPQGKAPAPAPTPLPASSSTPVEVASRIGDVTPAAGGKPAAVPARTRTKKLNEKVDEYITRTKNRMRSGSNLGSSGTKETPR